MRLPKFGLHHPYPDRQSAEQAAHPDRSLHTTWLGLHGRAGSARLDGLARQATWVVPVFIRADWNLDQRRRTNI
jgi:hypothetical protein